MPKAKKKFKRKFKKPYYVRRRFNKFSNIFTPSRPTVYSFKRSWQAANLNTTAAALGNSAYKFQLSDLPNASEFTTLFDSYRIMGVKMKLVPCFSNSDIVDTAAVPGYNIHIPNVHTVIDYDDVTALSAVTDYMQYDTYKMTRGNKIVKVFCKPRPQASMNVSGAAALAAQESRYRWIDCNQASVYYFGIKVGYESTGVAGPFYQVYFTYYLQFKSVR